MKTNLSTQEYNLTISHENINDTNIQNSKKDNVLFIANECNECNTLTTLRFDDFTVYFYWNNFGQEDNNDITSFSMSICDDTKVLFIAGGIISYSIDLSTLKIIEMNYNSCMHWKFQQHKGYIIELGELECFLFNRQGKLVGNCPVDPPYEIDFFEEGIKFTSIVMGEKWLKF